MLPTHFAWLSDDLLQELCRFYEVAEELGCWPQKKISTSLVHLIPKAAGGRRPIGLLPSLVRLWERARKPVMREWQQACKRTYNWMERGKGSERSVWAQALYEEAATAAGNATASVFLDLVKAFEQVVLGNVWRSGLAHHMPRRLLALALEACAFHRRLSFRGAVSEAAQTFTAILAGGGFATDLLFVTLVDAVDEILLQHEKADTHTTLRSFMIVDDIRLVVEGSEERVHQVLPVVAQMAVHTLEERLHMQVSRNEPGVTGKTVAQFSSLKLLKATSGKMRRLGVNVATKVKNLGAQFTAGPLKPSRNLVAVNRYQAGLRKVVRAQRIGRVAHRMALKSVLTPSFTYGSAAASCPRGIARQLRTQTSRTFGPTAGRSTTARLLLEDADVALTLSTKTITAWVAGVWDNLVEQETLASALRLAHRRAIATSEGPRGVLSGAAAYLDALRQVGWKAPSFDSVLTRSGHLLYFGSLTVPTGAHSSNPRFIRNLAVEDYEVLAMSGSTVARDLADLHGARGYPWSDRSAQAVVQSLHSRRGDENVVDDAVNTEGRAAEVWRRGRFEHTDEGPIPWLGPVKSLLRGLKRNKLWKVAASVRSLFEGGWPTQLRLFTMGLAGHPQCKCGHPAGTLKHKLSSCPLSAESRAESRPDWILRACTKEPWNPLFSRGVPARPKPPPVPQKKV